ncbi:12522_t:CDS:2, partial [Gigaspora rosea]
PVINSTYQSFECLLSNPAKIDSNIEQYQTFSNPLIVDPNIAQNQSFSNHLFELEVESNMVQTQIAFESVYYETTKFSNPTNRRLISPTTELVINSSHQSFEWLSSNLAEINFNTECNPSIELEFGPNMIQNQIFATNFDSNLSQNQNFRNNDISVVDCYNKTIDQESDTSFLDTHSNDELDLLLYIGLEFTK